MVRTECHCAKSQRHVLNCKRERKRRHDLSIIGSGAIAAPGSSFREQRYRGFTGQQTADRVAKRDRSQAGSKVKAVTVKEAPVDIVFLAFPSQAS